MSKHFDGILSLGAHRVVDEEVAFEQVYTKSSSEDRLMENNLLLIGWQAM